MAYTFGATYYFKSHAGYGRYMNVYGTETVANSRNVCLYDKENIGAQKWIIRQEAGYGKIYTSLAGGNAFALNLHSTTGGNCTMYTAAGNDKDSLLDLLTVNAEQSLYRIKLKNYNLYLTAESSANLGNVAWKALTDDNSFIWKLEPDGYVPPAPQPPPVPSTILNQTFFVKNANTGVYLNVNGYDTVANSTNVNVYSKTDCLAQRWVARQTATGGKLFTKINEAFALNIYNDNCTMYTAQGYDEDTLLEFVPYDTAQRIYRIKLFTKNKYLSSAAAASGSNAVWVDNIYANDYTLWKFETEAEAFPSGPPVPSAIANQTFFVKNYNTGLFLNVHGYDTVANSTNVNVYSFEDCQAQRWVARQTARGGKLFTKINEAYSLNIYNDNCTMYTAQGYDNDTLLEFVPYDVAQKIYRIKLVNHNKYLTVASVEKGSNATWTASASDYTLWKLETEEEARPKVPAVPAALLDKTFFVKDNKSGLYLNVYGTDTVVNTRNVNIYEPENCLAQRWVARQTVAGGKLHTKIDEAFALNIHVEAGNNCTMYDAQASGDDSVLEFSSYNSSENQYLIKMFHRDKYLTVATDDRGANVYWSDINDSVTVWTFVDEGDMTFAPSGPGEMFAKDSSLVTKVLPAHQNNFTQNRSGQGAKISEICIHHMAGNLSIETLGGIWQKPDRKGSSHYGVNGTQIGQYVKESDIAWTNSNWDSNCRSVTIETANSTGDPTWEIAGATYNTLIKLVADIARRNNLGTLVKGQSLTWHSMYAATQCPGPDLLRLMDGIVSEANRINSEGTAEIVYLRKNNSEMFLGSDISNKVCYVGQGSAKAWKMTGVSGKFTFADFNDPSLKLQVSADGVTPLLAPVTGASKLACGEYVNGKLQIFIEEGASAFKARATSTKLFMSTMPYPQGAGYSSDESNSTNFDVQADLDISTSDSKPSSIPSELSSLIGKAIKLKHKSTGMYLSHSEEAHPTGTGKGLSLKGKALELEQAWTIKDLGAGVYGIVSNANKNCAVEMEQTYNNCVSGTSGTSQLWKRGISIEAAGNSSYKLKFTAQDKYINAYTYQYEALLNATNSSSQVWELEECVNYLTYPTKVMRITQRHDGNFSHLPNSTGSPTDYPIDEICVDGSDRSYMYCPCDEMEIIRITGVGNNYTNAIWLRSTTPVKTPKGENYVVMLVVHPEDDDLLILNEGDKFTRGQQMFREGSDGFSTGNHFHISVGFGDIENNGWISNTKNAYVLTTTAGLLYPQEAYYIDGNFTTQITKMNGYDFISLP